MAKTLINRMAIALFSLAGVILAALFAMTNGNQATADTLLADKALRAQDTPELQVELWLSDEKINKSDPWHPLNNNVSTTQLTDSTLQEQMMAYQEGYQTAATFTWQGNSLSMGNYLYRYSSAAEAAQAQKIIVQSFNMNHQPTVETVDQYHIQGQSFSMGGENDTVFWYVGVDQDTVIMLMVDSMSVTTSKEAFAILLDNLLLKQK